MASYTDGGQLIISNVTDKQTPRLIKVSFDWRQVMTMAV